MSTTRIKTGRNYVDNEKLYESFVEWHAQREEAARQGKKEPEPPSYISECIVLIPTRLASKGNFSGYSFKEDMIGDAIENIIQYYRNFDPQKSKNPFAYFTQIAYYAFIRRILREKRHSYVKHKMIQNSDILNSIFTQEHDSGEDYHITAIEAMKANLNPELERYFESKKLSRNPRKTRKTIEDLLTEETNGAKEDFDA